MGLVEDVRGGDKRAAAKLISMIEDREPEAADILRALHRHTGTAHVVGFTGPPGAGKSSLISRLVHTMRAEGTKVGVIAVDPTSPFTGGALLGDRVRMTDVATDEGVFIRSMATRGHVGGLALAAYDAVKVLEALGMERVFVETVGAGQSEVEVASLAHTTVLVAMPGAGDAIQALKAGILEVGDIYVVNKADKEGADAVWRHLHEIASPRDGWEPPVLKTSALEDEGIEDLGKAIGDHRRFLDESGLLVAKEEARARVELQEALEEVVLGRLRDEGRLARRFDDMVRAVVDRRTDPRTAAETLVRALYGERDG
jgi:LAO/AO transport system kinase